jgi:hypothetical protein
MKYWLWGIIIGVFCAGAWADDAYRNFTDTQGRTIRARELSFDAVKDVVQIEAESGKKATIPLAGLIGEDQEYVYNWALLEGVRSESKFKIACERRAGKSWDRENFGTIRYTNGAVETNQVVGKTFFEETEYEITLRNRNDFPVDDLVLKYCIYYKQDVSAASEGRQGVLFGSEPLGELHRNEQKKFLTKPVVIFKDMKNSSFLNARVLKGEVDGIVLRICTSDQDGGEVLRTLPLPDSTAEKYEWHDRSIPIGANK